MNSTFTGLSIAVRGLYSSQAALSVTTNNISNVNTEGYTRQTVNQSAATPAAVYNSSAIIGSGSQVNSVDQIRDAQLDKKYWRENATVGEWETKADGLTQLEAILGDTSENGLSSVMDEFYSALEDLSSDPSSNSARTVVKQAGNSVCEYLNSTAQQLTDLRADVNSDIKTDVSSLNAYAEQIAALNKQIQTASATGASVNDLMDQRNLLIDKLSNLASIEVSEVIVGKQADGTNNTLVSITVNGASLVTGSKARQLEVYEISDGSSQDGLYGIRWQDTQAEFSSGGGSIQASLDLRDGTGVGSEYKGIPYYMNQLDEYARTFAMAFNEGMDESGYSGHADGVGTDGSTGIRFFSYDHLSSEELMNSGTDTESIYANITASNISLTKDVQDDVNKIAAASSTGESGNNENIQDLISLCEDSSMFHTGTPEDFINSVISTLASDSSYAQRQSDSHTSILNSITNRRSSVSGVSTNEETANLTKYQQAYEASAAMVNVWDEIYKETINLVSD